MPSQSEIIEVSKEGVRCQILDWFDTKDVIVGEGEFYFAEQQYKIGRIPIGPNAIAILIKSVIKPEASVWRPTTDVSTLEQALGVKIAWSSDKIIMNTRLNNRLVSSKTYDNKDITPDIIQERCTILDWIGGDLIAEGIMCSTNPTKLINDIPLGPNVVVLKVDIVFKPEAYLWRPSPKVFIMGDACNVKIAWPVDRIELLDKPAREGVVGKSTQSASKSASTCSKRVKKKCSLMDCNNSGRKVAKGRVCSTDPEDVFHHVSLDPNASKVWVEVSKVGNANVWKLNSEIQYISDAVGTTVTWPNDKLVF